MKKLLFLSIFIFSTIIQGMDNNNNNKNNMAINTIDDFPAQCAAMIKELDKQTEKEHYGSAIKKSKILLMDNWNDCRALEIIDNHVTQAPEEIPHIKPFGKLYPLFSKKFMRKKIITLGNGIQLYNKDLAIPALAAYEVAINNLKKDWKFVDPQQAEQKKLNNANDEWVCLTKETTWKQESLLIKFLANKMEFDENVVHSCPQKMLREKAIVDCFLSIKKSHLRKFSNKFCFDCFRPWQATLKRVHMLLILKEIAEQLNANILIEYLKKDIVLFAYPYQQ